MRRAPLASWRDEPHSGGVPAPDGTAPRDPPHRWRSVAPTRRHCSPGDRARRRTAKPHRPQDSTAMARRPSLIGLIANASAGGGAVRRRYLRRTPFWHSHIADSQVHITTSLAELDAAIVSLRDQRVEVLAVLGGDGTLHHAVDALLRHYPSEAGSLATPIVLALGGGTMNGVPRALGTRGRPEDVLR